MWEAQYFLTQGELNQTEGILNRLPTSTRLPLDSLLRARLAFERSHLDETPPAYDQALRHLPDHDGLRLEAALSFARLGLIDRSQITFEQLGGMGSRLSESYYFLARFAVYDQDPDLGAELLRTAWRLRPMERETLFASPILAALSVRPQVLPLLEISSSEEPVLEAEAGRNALEEVAALDRRLLGRLLEVRIGGGVLEIPAGEAIAPADTPREDVATRARRDKDEALALLEVLGETAAAAALGESHRWDEIVALTDGLVGRETEAPPDLLRLRAKALLQSDRQGEARRLLIDLAQSDLENRRRDPATYYQLGELMAASEEYDLAIRLIDKAHQLSPILLGETRVLQLKMEQRLAESFHTYDGEHFNIRYPASTGERYPAQISLVLEAERKRLLKYIPLRGKKKIGVDLFPLREFLRSYSQGVAVLGIYDGRVRVPFADLKSFHPLLVSILSHELAHAMITEYTGDQTPKWFHEGLAEHIQMVQDALNPIPDLTTASRILAFPLIESVLAGFGNEQYVELAYNEAAWVVHFIEARYGTEGIHRLLKAWHTAYTRRVTAVKTALVPVIRAYRGGQPPADIGAACTALGHRLDELFSSPESLDPPDGRSGPHLKAAFRHFREMARACRRGQEAYVRAELGKAEKELGRASRILAEWDLRP